MKLKKLLILAVILIFAIGSVSSLIARDKLGQEIITDPPPDGDPGGGVIEGDPWDDNNDDGPVNTIIYPGIPTGGKLIQWSIFRFWFTTVNPYTIKIDQPRTVRTRNAPEKLTK
jgi:hypothetical protein